MCDRGVGWQVLTQKIYVKQQHHHTWLKSVVCQCFLLGSNEVPRLSNGKKHLQPYQKHRWMEVILINFVPLQSLVACWHLSISITVHLSPPSDTLLKALEGARCLKAFGAISHWTGHLGTKRWKSEGHPRPDDECPSALVRHLPWSISIWACTHISSTYHATSLLQKRATRRLLVVPALTEAIWFLTIDFQQHDLPILYSIPFNFHQSLNRLGPFTMWYVKIHLDWFPSFPSPLRDFPSPQCHHYPRFSHLKGSSSLGAKSWLRSPELWSLRWPL